MALTVGAAFTGAFTVVTAVAELLEDTGSDSLALTVAVLLTPPGAVSVTTIVTVATAFLASVPKLQDTVFAPLHVPWVGVAETNVTPDSSVSVITTPVAVPG